MASAPDENNKLTDVEVDGALNRAHDSLYRLQIIPSDIEDTSLQNRRKRDENYQLRLAQHLIQQDYDLELTQTLGAQNVNIAQSQQQLKNLALQLYACTKFADHMPKDVRGNFETTIAKLDKSRKDDINRNLGLGLQNLIKSGSRASLSSLIGKYLTKEEQTLVKSKARTLSDGIKNKKLFMTNDKFRAQRTGVVTTITDHGYEFDATTNTVAHSTTFSSLKGPGVLAEQMSYEPSQGGTDFNPPRPSKLVGQQSDITAQQAMRMNQLSDAELAEQQRRADQMRQERENEAKRLEQQRHMEQQKKKQPNRDFN